MYRAPISYARRVMVFNLVSLLRAGVHGHAHQVSYRKGMSLWC
jgi:hypothetical protein